MVVRGPTKRKHRSTIKADLPQRLGLTKGNLWNYELSETGARRFHPPEKVLRGGASRLPS